MLARLIALTLAACLCATASAQNAPPTRIRGTIAALEGQTLSINTREGTKVDVLLNEPLTVSTVKKVELADIKPNAYVGIATRTAAGGELQALEVLVFPEAMRGAGEGHYPWDLRPQSMMTNGNVEQAVTDVNGQTLTLKYKDGEKKVTVPSDAPIVAFAPGDKSDLKPGVKIFIVAAKKQADGSLQAPRIAYGKDGLTPPM